MVKHYAYPRAALIGNPSDGYGGATIAFVFNNFRAEVSLEPAEQMEIVPGAADRLQFNNLAHFRAHIAESGLYGGIRLLKACLAWWITYADGQDLPNSVPNFRLAYESDIPQRLGLAGSSAIITACLRCLTEHWNHPTPPEALAEMALAVETELLGIPAGLQDRVAQAYERPVIMDFSRSAMQKPADQRYTPFSASLLPNLYIAYQTDIAEGSEVLHNDLRSRYEAGDLQVLAAMETWRALTNQMVAMLHSGNSAEIGALMNRNFDLRRTLLPLPAKQVAMVELARSLGASAKFTGSGGAIIGVYRDEAMFSALESAFSAQGATVIRPQVVDGD